MGNKTNRLAGRYGGEPDKAIADPGNEDVENPVIQSTINGGSNKSIRRPKEESKMPKFKDIIEQMVDEHCGHCPEDIEVGDVDEAVGGSWQSGRLGQAEVEMSRGRGRGREVDADVIGAIGALHKEVKNLMGFTDSQEAQLVKWHRTVSKRKNGEWSKADAQALEKMARTIHHSSSRINEIIRKLNEYAR